MISGSDATFPLALAGLPAGGMGALLILFGAALLAADLHIGARGAVAALARCWPRRSG
jgi:hypothetical protein